MFPVMVGLHVALKCCTETVQVYQHKFAWCYFCQLLYRPMFKQVPSTKVHALIPVLPARFQGSSQRSYKIKRIVSLKHVCMNVSLK